MGKVNQEKSFGLASQHGNYLAVFRLLCCLPANVTLRALRQSGNSRAAFVVAAPVQANFIVDLLAPRFIGPCLLFAERLHGRLEWLHILRPHPHPTFINLNAS